VDKNTIKKFVEENHEDITEKANVLANGFLIIAIFVTAIAMIAYFWLR